MSNVICPKCGNTVQEGKTFCNKCGTRITVSALKSSEPTINSKKVCPKCGKEWKEGRTFCDKCGARYSAVSLFAEVNTAPIQASDNNNAEKLDKLQVEQTKERKKLAQIRKEQEEQFAKFKKEQEEYLAKLKKEQEQEQKRLKKLQDAQTLGQSNSENLQDKARLVADIVEVAKAKSKEWLAKNKKKIIVISSSVLSALVAIAIILVGVLVPIEASINGYRASVSMDDGTVEIWDYNGKETEVVIPSEIFAMGKKRPVTSIGYEAFSGCSSLESVVIPDSVTSIGVHAFEGCGSLESVVIPDSVTSIGNGAFYGCSSLTSVVIGDSVTSIGYYAFEGCGSLESVVIPDSVTSIGEWAFNYCDSLSTVYYNGTEEEWSGISIGDDNSYLINATRYYYSETEPVEDGNYWHYVDGVPTPW